MPVGLDSSGVPSTPSRISARWPRALTGRASPPLRARDLGHWARVFRDGMLHAYLDWALEMQDDFVIWAGPTPYVIAVAPDSIQRVLTEDDVFVRNVAPTRYLFGRGMLRLEGSAWLRRKRLLAPPFAVDALQPVVSIVQEEADRLIARWSQNSASFRPVRDVSLLMLRILGRYLFGLELDEERYGGGRQHASLIALSTDAVLRHYLPWPVPQVLNGKRVLQARLKLDVMCSRILDEGGDTPFLSALRDAISRRDLDRGTAIDEVRTFLIAGHETSASALAWALALVAQHPSRSEALRAESDSAANAETLGDIAALSASNAWAKEAMRLFPPVPVSVSQTTRETRLGRLSVPRGTRVDVSSYVLHRLPWLWTEPNVFRPERFDVQPERGTYLPFLMGPHTCLGMRLAMAELPLALARLAGAFHFELPNGPPQVNLRLSLHPAQFILRAVRR